MPLPPDQYGLLKAALRVMTIVYDSKKPTEADTQLVRQFGAQAGLSHLDLEDMAAAAVRRVLGPGP